MLRYILATLLYFAVVIGCADAQSIGTLRQDPATNVVIFMADDTALEDVNQGCSTAIGCNSNVATAPPLDTIAATGLIVGGFYTTPQCNSTHVSLLTGNYTGQNWNYMIGGDYASAEPSLPRQLEEVSPGIVTMHFGKDNWGPQSGGMCSEDSYAPCNIDADCSGTCDLTTDDQIVAGFRYSLSAPIFNPGQADLYSYTHTLTTRTGQSPFAVSTSTNVVTTIHRDEAMAAEFDTVWNAHPYEPKFAILSTHAPHDVGGSFFDPLLAYPQALSSLASERAKYVDWVYTTVLGDVLTTIGDIDTETCLVVLGDNGALGSYVEQNVQGKFTNYSGGTQTGALFSGACLRGNVALGSVVDGTTWDLPDLHHFVVANYRAKSTYGTYPSFAGDDKVSGGTRAELHDDLAGYLWGFCDDNSPTCHSIVGDRYGAYWGGLAGQRTMALGDYRLHIDLDLAETTRFYDMADETAVLCGDDCPDGLTAAQLTAYNKTISAFSLVEGAGPQTSNLVFGNMSIDGGNPSVASPAVWRIETDLGGELAHPWSYAQCTIVWNDTGNTTSQKEVQVINGGEVADSVTLMTAESKVADVDCVDLWDPTTTYSTTFPYTVDP